MLLEPTIILAINNIYLTDKQMNTTIIINGDVSGDHNHIGNVIYNSYENYLRSTDVNYSSADKELLRLIFDNVKMEEEKEQIIQSLQSIKKGEYREDEKNSHVNVWAKFISYSQKFATSLTIDVMANKVADFLNENNAHDVWKIIKLKLQLP